MLQAAVATSAFAVLLGATSGFFAAICAWSESDARRQAGYACASVFGLIVMGLSLGTSAANGWAVVLTATYVPTSAAILSWFADRSRMKPRNLSSTAVVVGIVLLCSGICGQGGALGAGLGEFAKGGPLGHAPLALALAFGGSAEFFVALALTRAVLAGRFAPELSVHGATVVDEIDRFETSSGGVIERSQWPLTVLAVCGAAIGISGGALMLNGHSNAGTGMSPIVLAGGNAAATLIGCLPAVAGLLMGWRTPRPVEAVQLDPDSDGLLLRLGRNRFYCDALLFLLIALPVRAAAQFTRFADWFFIDGFVSGAPASAVEAAGLMLEPVQGRSVAFYLASAAVGTALLAAVVIWLRY
jgi:NADH:ubiquinone oxidoreductase subunit 5 (subunit L)/multisubunit Na+/H+ antiporter MnhA subunit